MSALAAERDNLASFLRSTRAAVRAHDLLALLALLSPLRLLRLALNALYILAQLLVIWAFKPPRPPPPPPRTRPRPRPRARIAVVGAGLTGVASAAHAVAHGFDVVLYEAAGEVGGIWARVNASSGLQLNSVLYRFHPAVLWTRAFPRRDEILHEIHRVWTEYDLPRRTRLRTRVASVRRAPAPAVPADDADPARQGHARWLVDAGADGVFDAVVVAVGTCGAPRWVCLPGMPAWAGKGEGEGKRKGEGEGEDEGEGEGRQDKEEGGRDAREPRAGAGQGSTLEPASYAETLQGTDKLKDAPGASASVQEKEKEKAPGAFGGGDLKDSNGRTRGNGPGKSGDSKKEGGGEEGDEGEEGDDGEVFGGSVLHSSELDTAELEGKRVVVIGSGASGVEAVETALARGAQGCVIVARDDKWIIPRNVLLDTLISAQPFGREMPLSFVWEKIITLWNYHGVEDLTPAHLGLFEGTPVVNDEFLDHVRAGRCRYVRGDTQRLTRGGVRVSVRGRGSKPGDEGHGEEFPADVVVLAVGFHKPDVGFLEGDLFPEGYDRPNLYLQNFSTEDWSVLMTNSAYLNAIGTV
ncbi:hypothetical protein AcW1_003266 [Taiwanofungus camphoratus]|nr:hypothetical protein AcW1_003266 [Antrodia cinnamomea]